MNIYIPRNVYTFNIIPSSTELENQILCKDSKDPNGCGKSSVVAVKSIASESSRVPVEIILPNLLKMKNFFTSQFIFL